ncbi:hypothetical protein WJX75_005140 [Coccomyxa subellipsoidea]|uniref:Uncharacterized protein n=1 Tax=Coccomyxa subellipsoidea TaxID=248742 RepID=A0ABR2Z3U9_9CHLO
MQPAAEAIYAMESEQYTLGNAYFSIRAMHQKVELLHDNDAMYPYEDDMKAIWNERKEYGYHPAFALAALLDPALNSLMDQVDAEDRVAAEALVVKLAVSQAGTAHILHSSHSCWW